MNQYVYYGLGVLLAYLVGSIPSAVWIGKGLYGIDVREHGSGNAGATNVIRILGYKAGIPVMLLDILKGWLAVQVVFLFPDLELSADGMTYLKIACAAAAVLGHIFPVYVGFRGGKGVGTLAGVAIALYPIALLFSLGIFILSLVITRYVSLSSILAGIVFPFVVIFITREQNIGLICLSLTVAIFIPVTHRKNIKRLLKGEENKFLFRRKKEGKT